MLMLLQHLNKQVNFKSFFFQQKILIKNLILIYVKLIIRIEKNNNSPVRLFFFRCFLASVQKHMQKENISNLKNTPKVLTWVKYKYNYYVTWCYKISFTDQYTYRHTFNGNTIDKYIVQYNSKELN